ncbi:uncharacterized protein [Vicugna pacos]|uniref:Ankyrin repeat domain-containing protein 7 n=1 Tax=Vicugna pacos TaxID=30538 RepID=A0ABM5CR04_VICPA
MKKVVKFMSWVGFRNLEGPEPLYIIDKSELPKLHRAAYLGYDEKLRKLLSRKKNAVDSRDKYDRTPLHVACISGCPAVVALLTQFHCDLNARDKERTTALIRAVQSLNKRCASILLEHGANPNLEDGNQNTALHYAILEESVSIATQLLRHNANIEAIDKSNLTPFLLAVKKNKKEMVKFLIENGANVHAVDNMRRSALMLAVFHDSPDIVKLLLQEGVSPYSQDSHGMSAEQYAYSNGFEQRKGKRNWSCSRVVTVLCSQDARADPVSAVFVLSHYFIYSIYQLIVDYRDGKILNTPSQNSDLGQNSAENLPSSHTGVENNQEELQLSSKDNEEDMVVKLGASNGSSMDSLKSVEKKLLRVKFAPRFEDLSVSSVSSIPGIDDSWHPSDDDSDLAPESTSKIQLPNHVDQLSGAAGQGEKNTLNGQIENSTEMHPHLKPAVGVKDSLPNKTGGMKNLQTFKSDWDSTSWRPNNVAGQRTKHLKVDKCLLVSQSVTTNQSAPTELRQTAPVDKDQMNIGAVSLSENAALRGLHESQLPENRNSKEADLDLEMTSKEEQEGLDGSENNQSQDTCVLQACTVKEKKSEGQIRQINLSPVHLQKMPGEPGMNKEQDRKDVPVSSKHSCVEKHEDMWVKKGKLDWKNNTKFITKKLNQKVSKIREKCKVTFHHKAESLHDNSELHGDLKELPSNMTNNICDSEEKDAPGASVSAGSQALPQHEEPSLENVFPSYSKSGSAKYGCQSSSKLYLNENKLT